MCGRARAFYASLFSPDLTDPGACRVLWEELPMVSVSDQDRLEFPLTLAEFSEALRHMPTNKSPGMDGLTVEFYRVFWDILGADLVTVWAESLQSGVLPLSCRQAVLALLPKKGDLHDLQNWRPVSLLSTDYKIIAKAISLRLGSVLADMIHPDQTYTVPDRSIFDNLFLVRDLLELRHRDGLSQVLVWWWWDVAKVHAWVFCLDCTRRTSWWRDAAIELLEREVLGLERHLAASPEDPSLCRVCWEKWEELRALKDHQAQGAFVRSHIRLFQEMDHGFRFFYTLEKKTGAKKHVTCLLAEDSTHLTDLEEICGRARAFYVSLFSLDPADPDTCRVLWDGLPTVSMGDRDRLELPLTLAKLLEALHCMPTNKSPGMDGLTVEIYRLFWGTSLARTSSPSGPSPWQAGFSPCRAGLVLREPELRLILSAYDDNVLLVVQDLGNLVRVEACQTLYSAASSTQINWVKSSGLLVRDWWQAKGPDLSWVKILSKEHRNGTWASVKFESENHMTRACTDFKKAIQNALGMEPVTGD
ncbi:unnamed protein product [Caretta caretta]